MSYPNWKQGKVLWTQETRRWTNDQWLKAEAEERKMLFENFTEMDEGRSRRLVARFEKPEDAALIESILHILRMQK